MKILVVGSGGREHALCWKLAQSSHVSSIHCAPGNAGIASIAQCVDIAATDIPALLAYAQAEKIGLTVVGPEAPLAAGIVDAFRDAGLPIFGPTQAAAQLEASKGFSKDLMHECGIPTAEYQRFTHEQCDAALRYAQDHRYPLVIKQDGLAAGKGVVIADTPELAAECITKFLDSTESSIVIESFLAGEELSCIAVASGTDYVLLAPSQDHKQIGEGDTGPNTGGMGAYSPVGLWTEDFANMVARDIVLPTLEGMERRGAPFSGFLYVGLMVDQGKPYVLEYNARLGDPEAQALLVRLQSDLLPVLLASANNTPLPQDLAWTNDTSVCVVMSSAGYPGAYDTGHAITGLTSESAQSSTVFHAGTCTQGEQVCTAGGRVLGVTALGANLDAARAKAYASVDAISWEGAYVRRDIGCRHAAAQHIKDAS